MTRTAALNGIYELAKKDERVIFVGSDLAPNTLPDFKRDFPDRYFMEGIAEQHIVGMAAGLAKEGYIPYVNTIASFITRRCYEQVVLDVCAHNLPVRLIGNGGGVLYAPLGLTHQSIEDISIMRSIPNMAIVCCSDSQEMTEFMPTTLDHKGPMYIRLGKDADAILERGQPYQQAQIVHTPNIHGDILMIGTGVMTHRLVKAAEFLGDAVGKVVHVPCIKPLDRSIVSWAGGKKLIVVAEEGIRNGGLGSAVLEMLNDAGVHLPVLRLGIPDAFPHHYGEQDDLLRTYGLQPEQMAKTIREAYDKL